MSLSEFHQMLQHFDCSYFVFTNFNKWISIISIFLNCLFQYFEALNCVFKLIHPFHLKYFLHFLTEIEFVPLNLLKFLTGFWFEATFLENLYLLIQDHLWDLLFSSLFFVFLIHCLPLFISESIPIQLFLIAFLHETIFVFVQFLYQINPCKLIHVF